MAIPHHLPRYRCGNLFQMFLFNIVFVHGFTGHPKSTWTLEAAKVQQRTRAGGQHGCDVFWPQDLLPTTVPSARILTYGYDTRIRHFVLGQISKNSVPDHGRDFLNTLEAWRRSSDEASRPLIFVAHSLGGLVVREALKQANHFRTTHPHNYAVLSSTIALMFFGTPHRGADPRSILHRVLSASVIRIGMSVNRHIVDTLLPSVNKQSELDDFRMLALEANLQVYSFQEEVGLGLLLGKKVVGYYSSYLGPPVIETIQHIGDNHMDMCRFYGFDDPGYFKVAAAFQRILASITAVCIRANPSSADERLNRVGIMAGPSDVAARTFQRLVAPHTPLARTVDKIQSVGKAVSRLTDV
ncbi:SesB protein [Neurospora crassa OR74A]|uniref:SesB protein n=1 Tax=Neurospora crassa (strain ATCC 24698 / 74-OR23-1A / CBS 708.71 / DSM 1257 / FGSC 987) TaxID=367110 RepID=Q7S512_NEUCR|nr:SesB protein [Neurospora crassa OR74A]EAA30651.1 SesB protein [Neurospora crassa OR74A]|eukprot:XP_959887.1 SesB protein [Neurospora crassa OR74A]